MRRVVMVLLGLWMAFVPIDGFRATGLNTVIRGRSTTPRASRCFAQNNVETSPPPSSSTSHNIDYLSPSSLTTKPESVATLAFVNFRKDVAEILKEIRQSTLGKWKALPPSQKGLPECLELTLSNEAVDERERQRELRGGKVQAHPVAKALYDIGCKVLDVFFNERPLERFWFLETIARIPYFVYISVLHLYESLGWWRETSLRRVHSAEEWNELHHLLIMESLGANKV
jgi:ubiquinol oxidase